MTTDKNEQNAKDERNEFIKLMLDNDMQSSLAEVESAEKVKDFRHRSNSLSDDEVLDTDSLLSANKSIKTYFTLKVKIIAGIIIGVLIVSLLATLS